MECEKSKYKRYGVLRFLNRHPNTLVPHFEMTIDCPLER